MKSNHKALINYYARLIHKKAYKMEDVQEEFRPAVGEALHALEAETYLNIQEEKQTNE